MNEMTLDKATEFKVKASEIIAMIERLEHWRENILEGLERGGGGYTFDDVLERCVNGVFRVYFWDDAYMIIQLAEYPQCRHYHVFLAGGNMETLIAAVPQLKRDAKDAGCQRLALNGRIGWWRVYKDRLPVKPYLTLTMELDDG